MSVIYRGLRSSSSPPHAVAVLVTPAVEIVASTIASPTVLETETPHHFVSGDTVLVAGHTGSTPAVDGSHVVTVIDALSFSIPLAVTVAGIGGTVTRTTAVEPLTLAEAKVYARLTGTELDTLLPGFLTTARREVEHRTGISLLLQIFDVYFDALPPGRTPIALPWRPVASIVSFDSIDSADEVQTLDVTNYHLDPGSAAPVQARVALSEIGAWPTDLRSFQPYVLRLAAGYASVDLIPAPLVYAVGLLIGYYANGGTDDTVPDQVEDVLAGFCPVVVA